MNMVKNEQLLLKTIEDSGIDQSLLDGSMCL